MVIFSLILMIYMTKRIFLISLFLSSCQQINWIEASGVVDVVARGIPNIEVDQDFFNEKRFSFIKISSGRYLNFTASLLSIDDDIYEWVTNEGNKIYTKNGKIIKVSAQPENSFYHQESVFNIKLNSFESNIFFSEPKALISQFSQLGYSHDEEITYLDNKLMTRVFFEQVETEFLKWKYVNKYWIDKDSDLVLRSEQYIYPFRKSYLIDYYYKY